MRLHDYGENSWDEARCLEEFAAYFRRESDDRDGIEAVRDAMNHLDCWPQCVAQLSCWPHPDAALATALMSFWNTYGLWSIPRGLRENLPIFVDALKCHLPRYDGPSMTLFRGELEARHKQGIYGILDDRAQCGRDVCEPT
jgi:hypothetical protein